MEVLDVSGVGFENVLVRTMPKLSARNAERDICRLFACASFFFGLLVDMFMFYHCYCY